MIPRGMTAVRGCLACGNDHDEPFLQCAKCRSGEPVTTTAAKNSHRALLPKKSEEDVRMEIRAWAYARGALFVGDYEQGYRPDACKHCGGKLSHSTRVPEGTPDLLVFWPAPRGQWWIECKSSTGKQTPNQIKFQTWVVASGGVYVLARSIEECESVWRAAAVQAQ